MRITRWGEYGIHCSIFIAQKSTAIEPLVSAQDIADSQAIPVDYARQILQRLKNGGIIKTVRGPLGGYQLSRDALEISLADILRASEGDTFEIICDKNPLDNERCSANTTCNIKMIWHKLHDHIDGFLKEISLKEMASQPCRNVSIGMFSQNGNIGKDKEKPVRIGG